MMKLSNFKSLVLSITIFLFPLFFLTTTADYYAVNKMYLLALAALILLAISTIEFIVTKKLVFEKTPLDIPLIIFPITIALSTIISSLNKIQALFNPNLGLVSVLSLTIIAYYLSRQRISTNFNEFQRILTISSAILGLITIIVFLPFVKYLPLPTSFAFMKNPGFTPLGSQLDLIIFLGFALIINIPSLLKQSGSRTTKQLFIIYSIFIILSLAFLLTLYSLLKPIATDSNRLQPILTTLPPFRLSWYAAVEILKNPASALFGVGIDNFSSIFTRVKDVAYNQSVLWQTNSFNVSRSAFLHIFTEAGLFGFIAFGLMFFVMIKAVFKQPASPVGGSNFILYSMFFIIFFFPLSLPILFLLYLSFAVINQSNHEKQTLDVSEIMPLYIATILISAVLVVGSAFLLFYYGYLPEYYFGKSISGIAQNNIKILYDNERQAILINPYIEKLRTSFSQTNLLIANNLANKVQSNPSNPSLSDQDRQTIAQAIQAAISEAKAAVTLNPQKAGNWENLAAIYRNILNVAQGADAWTTSAYQRAIVLDPQNPIYRLNLGGVFYSLKNYDEAYNLFAQTVALKSDWANAYYNLAWASFQKGAYQQAVNAMQNAIDLLDPKTSKADLEKAKIDLEEFKNKLPKSEETQTPAATQSATLQKQQLTLPTPPASTISPKIELPKTASPEAK